MREKYKEREITKEERERTQETGTEQKKERTPRKEREGEQKKERQRVKREERERKKEGGGLASTCCTPPLRQILWCVVSSLMEPCRYDMGCWRPLCPYGHSGRRAVRWAALWSFFAMQEEGDENFEGIKERFHERNEEQTVDVLVPQIATKNPGSGREHSPGTHLVHVRGAASRGENP